MVGVPLYLMGGVDEAQAVQQAEIANPAPSQQEKQPSDSSGTRANSTANGLTNTGKPDDGTSASSDSLNASAAPAAILGLSWINQQPHANYTLQVMAAVSPALLQKYAHKESLAAPLAIACFQKDDKVMHLLLQGSYTTRSEAESVAAQLGQEKGLQPWVRKFASLPVLFPSDTPPVAAKHASVEQPPPPIMGAAWLWSRNPVHYTIQLMEDSRVVRLKTFVDKARPPGPLAIVRGKRKGKPWFLLFAGDYASKDEALTAIKALPKRVRGAGPWPRSVASLQDHMVASNH